MGTSKSAKNFRFTVKLKNEWTVIFTNRIPKFTPNQDVFGATHRHKKKGIHRIYVDRREPVLTQFETLVHELGHAFEMDFGLTIPHKLIEALEKPIVQFLMSNYGITLGKAIHPRRRPRKSPGRASPRT